MMKIIHISDFHLEQENISIEKENIIEALSEDLKKHVDDNTILCLTGDLIDKGGKGFDNLDDAYIILETILIDKILESNPKLKGKIFVVAGNHDINRNKIDSVSEAGLKSLLNDEKSLNDFIKSNRSTSNHLDRISNFISWSNGFYSKYNSGEISNFDSSFILNLSGLKVGITCLNSSWLCKDDNDKGNLLIGKNQIENSLKYIKDCNIKIALAHHPIEFTQKFDRDSVKSLLYKHYDLFLTGHVHELDAQYTKDLFGDIFVSIANSTVADNPKEKNSQMVILLSILNLNKVTK